MKKVKIMMLWVVATQFLLCASMPRNERKEYFRYKVIFRYPKTFCIHRGCPNTPPYYFTVQEIKLPDRSDEDRHLPDDILDEQKQELLRWWPDLKAKTFTDSKPYWNDTYKTSGAYGAKVFSPEEYIALGVFHGKKYGKAIISYLQDADIHPDERRTYTPADIGEAIINATKSKPEIVCILHEGHFYLYQIRLCFSNMKVIIDCFRGLPNYCRSVQQVYYPLP